MGWQLSGVRGGHPLDRFSSDGRRIAPADDKFVVLGSKNSDVLCEFRTEGYHR